MGGPRAWVMTLDAKVGNNPKSMAMSLVPTIAAFVERSKTYAERAGLKPSTVSRKIFNDGKYLDRLAGGGDIGVQTLEQAEERLAELEESLPSVRDG